MTPDLQLQTFFLGDDSMRVKSVSLFKSIDGETNLKNFIQNSTSDSTDKSVVALFVLLFAESYSRLSAVCSSVFAEVYEIVIGAQFYT